MIKARQHVDLRAVGGLRTVVDRLLGGARVWVVKGSDLVVMADLDGNEFCVET